MVTHDLKLSHSPRDPPPTTAHTSACHRPLWTALSPYGRGGCRPRAAGHGFGRQLRAPPAAAPRPEGHGAAHSGGKRPAPAPGNGESAQTIWYLLRVMT